MAENPIKLLDVVALTIDLPDSVDHKIIPR